MVRVKMKQSLTIAWRHRWQIKHWFPVYFPHMYVIIIHILTNPKFKLKRWSSWEISLFCVVFPDLMDVVPASLHVSVIFFCAVLIVFSSVSCAFFFYNAFGNPYETLHGPQGLYLWNMISCKTLLTHIQIQTEKSGNMLYLLWTLNTQKSAVNFTCNYNVTH